MDYAAFLENKSQLAHGGGFAPLWMPEFLFDFQQYVTEWSLLQGRCAIFADCGMGKTPMELVWAENVVRNTNRPVLILTPLAVAQQTIREGEKFGIEVYRSNDGKIRKGINVTNYEKLHYFTPSDFAGVVCDESSAIKAFNGKRRAEVTEFLRTIQYRLMATATAAPNDYIELGTTSEALGIMGQMDMLSRYFKNDQNATVGFQHRSGFNRAMPARVMEMNRWRFKGHAEIPFWRWVCGWARAGRRPSDFGDFTDDRFKLPPLIEREHIVETRTLADGYLLPLPACNRQEELEERRRTIPERCEMAAELVANTGKPYVIWCHLNDEGDLLEDLCRDAVQISGSESDDAKEEKWWAFITGQSRGVVSKQRIGGWGLNFQHCAHVVEFASHSFEAHYQGVRRCWRFGQKHPVVNDIIATEGEKGAKENMRRKSEAADKMFDALVRHVTEATRYSCGYQFSKKASAPAWLTGEMNGQNSKGNGLGNH